MTLIVYGAEYSVYTRIVRMALMLKGVEFRLESVDIFDPDHLSDDYKKLHPFLKIPVLQHDDFCL